MRIFLFSQFKLIDSNFSGEIKCYCNLHFEWSFCLCQSDGQQFHKYQQDEQSPLISKHLTQKKRHDIRNPGPGWDFLSLFI